MGPLNAPAEMYPAPAPLTHKDIRQVFYGLMLGGFLSAVNQTIVASALPTINPAGIAVAESFRFVFVAALVVSVLALLAVVLLEERTLHGPAAAPDERGPRSPEAVPAE